MSPGRLLLAVLILRAPAAAQLLRFDFTQGDAKPGFIRILPATTYSNDRGYGFETTTTRPPFYFSFRVPEEGNYRIKVTMGDPAADSVTTIKAELRRLMLERVRVSAGRVDSRKFIVNVRTPKIPGSCEVRLKDREKTSEAWAWDERITIEFADDSPSVRTMEVEKANDLPTIYIAGDSTSTDQALEPYNSWGQMITRFFKPEIAVANHGESGESLRSFIGEGRFAKVMGVIRPGDWLLIQMGHNDQKERGKGVGAFTSYKADLKAVIAEARRHGAQPVLITSMHRLTFDSAAKMVNSLGDYPEAVRQAAKEENVALVDLNAMSKILYEALGPHGAQVAFAGSDTTHHSDYGSYEMAKCVVEGIRQAKLLLARFLVDTPRFDPAHPDPFEKFDIPAEPAMNSQRPYGQ